MLLSAEITMYPLQEEYIPVIQSFIEKLNTYSDLKVQTVPTATIIMGEFDVVMDVLKDAMKWSREQQGKAVFITKFLPGYEAL